ncbi:MAG: hypothetical protein JOZ65_00210 [Chloroflexi bacterium]|nr:hypothetical protein [Chloroflexota bacterium]
MVRLYALLARWCVAVLVPGALTLLGVFGHVLTPVACAGTVGAHPARHGGLDCAGRGPHGVPAYEAVLDGLYMLGNLPSPGDRIALPVDPKKPQHIVYDTSAAKAALLQP